MKRLLNSHGKFSLKSFFHGVKIGYLNVAAPLMVFLTFYFACVIIGDWRDLTGAKGGSVAGATTAYVFIIIATVLVGVYCAWLIATGVSYKLKVGQLLKNAFVLMVGSPVQTVFFAGMSLIPVWIFVIGLSVSFIKIFAYIIFIFIGFSFILLVWMSYTQWVFDLYVTPNLKKAEEEAKAKRTPEQVKADEIEESKRVAMELLASGRSELICKPILPIQSEPAIKPLSATFTRKNLSEVKEERAKLSENISAYENEHKNDAVYKEYNALFAEREKALKEDGKKKGKKKKISSENLLK